MIAIWLVCLGWARGYYYIALRKYGYIREGIFL